MPSQFQLPPGYLELLREVLSDFTVFSEPYLSPRVDAMLELLKTSADSQRSIPSYTVADRLAALLRFGMAAKRNLKSSLVVDTYRRQCEASVAQIASYLSSEDVRLLRGMVESMHVIMAWDLFTTVEQKALGPKLPGTGNNAADQFKLLLRTTGIDAQATVAIQAYALALKNLMDGTGAFRNGAVWLAIESIAGGWVTDETAEITVAVGSTSKFLAVLKANGYQVDDSSDVAVGQLGKLVGMGVAHKHTARQLTRDTSVPGLHFVQEGYHKGDYFNVHVDGHSTACTECGGLDRAKAGYSHWTEKPLPAAVIREKMRAAGMVNRP